MKNNDYKILMAGYNTAIGHVLEIVEDENLKEKIIKRQAIFKAGDNFEYEAKIMKFYDKRLNLGYVIIKDILGELKGVCIFLDESTFAELDEKELLFIIENNTPDYLETINNKESAFFKYNLIISKWDKKA